MKRMAALCFGMMLCFAQMPTVQAVGTSASSAILMEAESGRVLYEQNAHQPRLIASITKLMTALVALNSDHKLSELVTVPPEAVGVEGSSIYLKEGEEISLEALLYGMLLRSGNDAAAAIAIHCGEDIEGFAAAMNQKAVELGMKNSHFENPHGLNAAEHYSSAYDMALLARACLDNENLAKIVSSKQASFGARSFTNHNKLLWQCEGCIGLKTGYTEKAGRTLVSAVNRDGMTLIAVTLHAPDDWNDHKKLYDWGFERFTMVEVTQKDAVWGRLPVKEGLVPFVAAVAEERFSYPLTKGDQPSLGINWNSESLASPVRKGERLGTLHVSCNGQRVGEIPLLAAQSVNSDLARDEGLLSRILRGID